jgi:hypothetical protein
MPICSKLIGATADSSKQLLDDSILTVNSRYSQLNGLANQMLGRRPDLIVSQRGHRPYHAGVLQLSSQVRALDVGRLPDGNRQYGHHQHVYNPQQRLLVGPSVQARAVFLIATPQRPRSNMARCVRVSGQKVLTSTNSLKPQVAN